MAKSFKTGMSDLEFLQAMNENLVELSDAIRRDKELKKKNVMSKKAILSIVSDAIETGCVQGLKDKNILWHLEEIIPYDER